MQHLIQFTFDFEDDNIRKKIESGIEKQVVSKYRMISKMNISLKDGEMTRLQIWYLRR